MVATRRLAVGPPAVGRPGDFPLIPVSRLVVALSTFHEINRERPEGAAALVSVFARRRPARAADGCRPGIADAPAGPVRRGPGSDRP